MFQTVIHTLLITVSKRTYFQQQLSKVDFNAQQRKGPEFDFNLWFFHKNFKRPFMLQLVIFYLRQNVEMTQQ